MTPEELVAIRGKTHGHFRVHAGCTQDLKQVIAAWRCASGQRQLTAVEAESLDMIVHKIGRIVAGAADFQDHWDDIAGYATLVSKEIQQTAIDQTHVDAANG